MAANQNNNQKWWESKYYLSRSSIYYFSIFSSRKKGRGALEATYLILYMDPMVGKNTWEKRSELMKQSAESLGKAGLKIKYSLPCRRGSIRTIIATSFGIVDLEIPTLGIYGLVPPWEGNDNRCYLVDGDLQITLWPLLQSFAGAEKQFRFPWIMEISVLIQPLDGYWKWAVIVQIRIPIRKNKGLL